MNYINLGTKNFAIAEEKMGDYPNSTTRMTLTVGQYSPSSFDPRNLDELISLLKTFKTLREGGEQQ